MVVKKVAPGEKGKKAAEAVPQAQITAMKEKAKADRAARKAQQGGGGGAKHAGKGR